MRSLSTLFFFLCLLCAFGQGKSMNENLVLGETLNYKIKYGWFKIGEAQVYNDNSYHEIDGVPHYRVQFNLQTVGWLKIFANLDLEFESFVNANNFRPHHAKRLIKNGKKSNSQYDEFNYQDSIYVKTYKEENQKTKNNSYALDGPTFTDALSTYLFVRAQNLLMDRNEEVRFYIANRIYNFTMKPNRGSSERNSKFYELVFPPIKEFPPNKTSYAILDEKMNIPLEIKLATNNGNFFLVLDD